MKEQYDLTAQTGDLGRIETSGMGFGERYRYVSNILKERQEKVLQSPYMIEIMPEATCQLACNHCSYGKIRKIEISNSHTTRLPFELLKSLLESISGKDTKGIFLSGGGEPLSYPYIQRLLAEAGDKVGNISIQTNGLNLDKLYLNPTCLFNVKIISVSIYGADKEIFLAATGRNNRYFDLIKERVEFTRKIIDQYSTNTILNAKILITRDNYKGIIEMIAYCMDCGFDSITLRLAQNLEIGYQTPQDKALTTDQQVDLVARLQFIKHLPFVQNLISKIITARPVIPSQNCYTSSLGMLAIVDTDGEVYLGTPDIGIKELSIGNLHTSSFSNLWLSERHFRVISEMNEMQLRGVCDLLSCRHSPAHRYLDSDNTKSANINDPLISFI